MRKPVVFSVTIDQADYEALRELAEAREVTLATVVREALGTYVARRRER